MAPTLTGLAERYALVAVVSGRPALAVRQSLGAPELPVFGLYGWDEEGSRSPSLARVAGAVHRLAGEIEGARVEDKGATLAVHYRQAEDPGRAAARLGRELAGLAEGTDLRLVGGKMVWELVPADLPGKGAVILREFRSRSLRACLFAGDDEADLDGFAALRLLEEEGAATLAVAVGSSEAPPALLEAADVVVEGPVGLLGMLSTL